MNIIDIINKGEKWIMEGKCHERFVIVRRRNVDGLRVALFKSESAAGDVGVVAHCIDKPGRSVLLTANNWEVIGTCDSRKEYNEKVADL